MRITQGLWDQMSIVRKFQMKLVYKILRDKDQGVPQVKLLRHNNDMPISLFTFWVAYHRKLAKKDRLKKFDMIDNNEYHFCNKEDAINYFQFLFECEEMKQIWGVVLKWIQIDHVPRTWEEEI